MIFRQKKIVNKLLLYSLGIVMLGILVSFNPTDWVVNNVFRQYAQYMKKSSPEIVFLHTDRNFYQTGDSLWFKAYIFDYHTHQPSHRSKTLHVSILGPDNQHIEDKRFLINRAGSDGMFYLPNFINEGVYKIIAYTSWMRNYSHQHAYIEEFQVKKLDNAEDVIPEMVLNIDFTDSLYQPGDKVIAEVRSKSDLKEFKAANFEYDVIDQKMNTLSSGKGMVLNKGKSLIQFHIPPNLPEKKAILKLKAELEEKTYYLNSPIPMGEALLDFQVFPEGGHLIAGIDNKVAFKAIGINGEPLDVEGWLIDEKGSHLKKIKSFYQGMGSFFFQPEFGLQYTILLDKPYSVEFSLPEIKENGINFTVLNPNAKFLTSILSSSNKNPEKVHMTLTLNGKIYYAVSGMLMDKAMVKIPVDKYPVGVGQLTLFDERGVPISERLVFINKHKMPKLAIELNQDSYQARERVELTLKAFDYQDNPINADFSVSVVDQEMDIFSNPNKAGIDSYAFLKSELKGEVPTPGFYFSGDDNTRNAALDLVMMTHGWRKYSLSEISQMNWKKQPDPEYQEYLKGSITQKNGNLVPNATMNYMVIGGGIIPMQTDKQGIFQINDPYVDEKGVDYLLHALKGKNKSNNVVLNLEIGGNDPFLESIMHDLDKKSLMRNDHIVKIESEYSNIDRFSYYDDLGKYQLLKEIVVREEEFEEIRPDRFAVSYRSIDTDVVRGEDLEPAYGFMNIIRQVRPAMYQNAALGRVVFGLRNIYMQAPQRLIQGIDHMENPQGRSVLFIVDGIPLGYDVRNLDYLTVEQIDLITVVRYPQNTHYGGYFSREGIVFVRTKNLPKDRKKKNTNFRLISGYQVSKEFYHPKYETVASQEMKEPDLRPTFYWEPNLKTDGQGVATTSFYNSDRVTTVKIRVNGVGENQELIFGERTYPVSHLNN